jgi:ABC-type sugar transport system permease subunit
MTGLFADGSEWGAHNATLFFVLYLIKKRFSSFKMGYASTLAWILFVVILVFYHSAVPPFPPLGLL